MHPIADQTVFGRLLPDELILVILELFNDTDLRFFRLVGRKQERFVANRVFGHISVRAAAGDWDLFHLAKLIHGSHAFCTTFAAAIETVTILSGPYLQYTVEVEYEGCCEHLKHPALIKSYKEDRNQFGSSRIAKLCAPLRLLKHVKRIELCENTNSCSEQNYDHALVVEAILCMQYMRSLFRLRSMNSFELSKEMLNAFAQHRPRFCCCSGL